MNYNSSTWKHKLRFGFYNLISPAMYIAIMPFIWKLFNKERRGCTYRFKAGRKGIIVLYDDKTTFHFVGYRRINRYLHTDGVERKKNAMKKKYCYSHCEIEPGDLVVEVGANVGEFTLMASEKAQRVIAFEPDPNCFFCLSENTKSIGNIEIIKKGVSNTDKAGTFYISSQDADSSLLKPKVFEDKMEVDFVRLDTWITSNNITKIDFLKVEAEGAEVEVLEGLAGKIDLVQKISVDAGPERYGQPTSAEVNQILISNGFTTQIMNHHVYGWKEKIRPIAL